MSKLLVIGVGPHPEEGLEAVSGPTIRLRQFTGPLAAAGHAVSVVMLESGRRKAEPLGGIARAVALPPEALCDPKAVVEAVGAGEIDAVLGVGSLMPAAAAGRVGQLLDRPVWIDFFGDPLAEWHGDAFRPGAMPDFVAQDHIWKFVRESLLTGDRFSVVSERQRAAVVGQLLLLGRMRAAGALHERVVTLPCGVPAAWAQPAPTPPFPECLVRRGFTKETRYVYVGGSWTSWLDAESMARSLCALVTQDLTARVVICGGSAAGVASDVQKQFFEAWGPDRDPHRVVVLEPGEGPEDSLPAYAITALLLDREIPESWLGSRNRLLSFVRWGLCPVVSMRSEAAAALAQAGLARGVATGEDVAGVVRALRDCMASGDSERNRLRETGRKFLASLTFERTVAPVVAWAGSPDRFPQTEGDGLLPRWAALPAEPEILFSEHLNPQRGRGAKRFRKS